MKGLHFIILGAVLAIVVLCWLAGGGTRNELRARRAALTQQSQRLLEAQAENDRLRHGSNRANTAKPLSESQLAELLALRNEVGQLRRATNDIVRVQKETGRLRKAIKHAEENPDEMANAATILYEDEIPLREARVAQLRAWLADRPELMIPELQFLTESNWLRSAEWDAVTDESFEGWISAQRGNATGTFVSMTYKAIKAYAAANGRHFPTEVSQLQPYYESPIDEKIFQRWEIVPSSSLHFIGTNWRGGNWAITEKAPINKKYDSRNAIGLNDFLGTLQEGRWDSVK